MLVCGLKSSAWVCGCVGWSRGNRRIGVVLCKEGLLGSERVAHRQLPIYVSLTPVYYSDVAVAERVELALEDFARIGAMVHEVELC